MSLKRTASSGIKWVGVSNVGRRVISLGANIVLARLLAPDDFGIVAMAALVTSFLELFRDLGTGSAIVQQKEVDDTLLSSIFWANACFGLLVAGLLAALAPAIGWFYHEPRVEPLLRVMAASFVLSSLGIVQNALMARELRFDLAAKLELMAAGAAAGTGISMAYLGYGAWSLVAQTVASSALGTALLWLAGHWRPRLTFSAARLRGVMGYSLNLTASNVLNFAVRNADNLLIGRFLGAEALGLYDLAYRLMLYPLQGISAVVGRVMFPLLSRLQDDAAQFRYIYLQVNVAIALISFPVMFGFFAMREPAVYVLLGEKWAPVVTLLALFAPLGAIQSISTTVGTIYLAKGRTRLMLGWSVVAFIVVMVAFVVGLNWGVIGVAASYTIASLILTYPNFAVPMRLIDLPVSALAKALWRPLTAALVMAAVVVAVDHQLVTYLPHGARLGLGVVIGAVVYMAMIWAIFRPQAEYVLRTLKGQ